MTENLERSEGTYRCRRCGFPTLGPYPIQLYDCKDCRAVLCSHVVWFKGVSDGSPKDSWVHHRVRARGLPYIECGPCELRGVEDTRLSTLEIVSSLRAADNWEHQSLNYEEVDPAKFKDEVLRRLNE